MGNLFKRKIIGYFGEHTRENLGDVAVYTAMSQHRIWKQLFTLIDFRKELDWKNFRAAVNRSSSILIGGGTQISALNKGFFDIIQNSRKPVSTFGTGVGSCGFYEDEVVDLQILVPFLKEIENLTVRGPLSLTELKKYGVYQARIIGDPALGYAQGEYLNAPDDRRICVNLTLPISEDEIKVYTNLFYQLSLFLQQLVTEQWTIDFFALEPFDAQAIHKFIEGYGISYNRLFCIYSDPNEYLNAVASADFVLGIRLHSAVLAACVGVPFLLVNYRQKCYDFASSINQMDCLIDPQKASLEELISKKDWILKQGNSLRQEILDSANRYKSIQLEFLDQLSTHG